MVNLTKYEKAILDTIAYAEGTLGVSNNGYDVVVTFKLINGWTKDTKIIHGNGDWKQGTLTAAGRYQVLGSTWISENNGRNVPMTKDNQDATGIKLINKKLASPSYDKRVVNISELVDRSKFDIFLQKCASTWASLPMTKTIVLNDGTTRKEGESWKHPQPTKGAKELYDIFTLALTKYS